MAAEFMCIRGCGFTGNAGQVAEHLCVISYLDAIDGGDPECAHSEADRLILNAVPVQVQDAYKRVMSRCRWWACA